MKEISSLLILIILTWFTLTDLRRHLLSLFLSLPLSLFIFTWTTDWESFPLLRGEFDLPHLCPTATAGVALCSDWYVLIFQTDPHLHHLGGVPLANVTKSARLTLSPSIRLTVLFLMEVKTISFSFPTLLPHFFLFFKQSKNISQQMILHLEKLELQVIKIWSIKKSNLSFFKIRERDKTKGIELQSDVLIQNMHGCIVHCALEPKTWFLFPTTAEHFIPCDEVFK